MRRHGVPGSTRIELCQAQLQLAGTFFQHVVDNEFINGAVVALLQRTNGSPNGSLQGTFATVEGNPLRLVVLMGSGSVQVELSGFLGILRAEEHFLVHVLTLADVPTADIECFLRRKRIFLTVNDDPTVTLAAVYHAELAIVKEILVLNTGVNIESEFEEVLELQVFRHRHGTTENKAVVVRVGQMNLVSFHHLFHHETLTKRLRVVVLHVFRMAGRLEFHVLLGIDIERAQHESHC